MSRILGVSLLLLLTLAVGELHAQTDAESTSETSSSLQDAGANLVSKLQNAFNGNTVAQESLIEEYLVPAAMALILLIAGYLFASFLGRVVGNQVSKRVDKTVGRFVGKIVQNSMIVLVILGALGYFGVDVTSFAAIIAACGFAVGMALQGTLSNFAAGVMLMVFRPFKIDDYIAVNGTEGTVEEIDLFTTKLNTPDNKHIIVPNGNIFGETMTNFSRNSIRRVDVTVGVAYEADIRHTRSVLENCVFEVRGGLKDPEPVVYLSELGDSAVVWQCRVWVNPEDYWSVRENLTEAVKYALDSADIGIPYPQMDIHVAGKLFAKAA
ncbi:MAG: mechanosensitive ion channel domain-containing protein [Planctomycetota bacterium]